MMSPANFPLIVMTACVTIAFADGRTACGDDVPGESPAGQMTLYFQRYCIDCHGADEQMAGIAVHDVPEPDALLRQRDHWLRVMNMVKVGAMPPEDIEPRPTSEENRTVAQLLHTALLDFDCDQVARPGPPVIRRLNRAEYNNTVRDLFQVDLRPADSFPTDDVGEGFDNIGGLLSVSPPLMEKYLAAAEQITDALIDTTDYSIPQTWTAGPGDITASHENSEFLPDQGFRVLNRPGTIFHDFDIPASGEYQIHIEMSLRNGALPDSRVRLFADDEDVSTLRLPKDDRPRHTRRKAFLKAGKRRVSLEFTGEFGADVSEARPAVHEISVKGPIGESQPAWSETHRAIVTAQPDESTSVSEAARQVLAPLLRRAFRRPVTPEEISRYLQLIETSVRDSGHTYESAVALAVRAMLVSPDFLFRIEASPDSQQPVRELDDHEIAVRLSYFLWSSMPDTHLFQLADAGRLREPDVLRSQIRRMLQDQKAVALFDNFAAQWLNLRNLAESTPDPELFAEFDEELRQAMLRETSLLFQWIVREDRPVDELLNADFTFVNRRLAEHYGITGVEGDAFDRVSLAGTNRRGVLTHASVLTLTSYPQRTSPVQRGKWILENILGDAPPPPPPDIPALESAEVDAGASLRERMKQHRKNAICASCHQAMDPLGLGLEHFDAIGRWRDQETGMPVDSSGVLPSGEEFDGAGELVEILLKRRDEFERTLAGRMLVYATGRGLKYYDQCVIEDGVRQMNNNDHRFSSLVESIVLSDAFLKCQSNEAP